MSRSLHIEGTELQVEQYGHLIILRPRNSDSISLPLLAQSIQRTSYSWIKEVIGTKVELAIITGSGFKLEKLQELTKLAVQENNAGTMYTVPFIVEDGHDWEAMIAYTQKSKQQILTDILDSTFTLDMHGFMPGFLYLAGLPAYLNVPRKKIPAIKVRAGAVAIGGPYMGIYSADSPAGWHILGHTPLRWITKGELPMGALKIGDGVRFQLVDEIEFDSLQKKPLSVSEYKKHLNA